MSLDSVIAHAQIWPKTHISNIGHDVAHGKKPQKSQFENLLSFSRYSFVICLFNVPHTKNCKILRSKSTKFVQK
jgi:hypothetical protein